MNKAFYLLLLLVSMGFGFSQDKNTKSAKLVRSNNYTYMMGKLKDYVVLRRGDQGGKYSTFKIPAEMPSQLKVAYDIYKNSLYTVSVYEFAPRQYSIYLIISELQNLDTLQATDTLKGRNEYKLFSPGSISKHLKIDPLSQAIYQSQISITPLYYSLSLSPAGEVRLFIYFNGHLTIWQLKDEQWISKIDYPVQLKEDFDAVVYKGKDYIITKDGLVYEAGETLKERTDKKLSKDAYILTDKDKDEVLSLEKPATPLQDPDKAFKNSKKVF